MWMLRVVLQTVSGWLSGQVPQLASPSASISPLRVIQGSPLWPGLMTKPSNNWDSRQVHTHLLIVSSALSQPFPLEPPTLAPHLHVRRLHYRRGEMRQGSRTQAPTDTRGHETQRHEKAGKVSYQRVLGALLCPPRVPLSSHPVSPPWELLGARGPLLSDCFCPPETLQPRPYSWVLLASLGIRRALLLS